MVKLPKNRYTQSKGSGGTVGWISISEEVMWFGF
jgi:hypothetical protein